MAKFRIVSMGLLMSTALGLAPAVQAADHEFCRNYASAAVNQFHDAERHPRCGYLFRQGNRWSPDYRMHYDWCRGADWHAADEERRTRNRELYNCR